MFGVLRAHARARARTHIYTQGLGASLRCGSYFGTPQKCLGFERSVWVLSAMRTRNLGRGTHVGGFRQRGSRPGISGSTPATAAHRDIRHAPAHPPTKLAHTVSLASTSARPPHAETTTAQQDVASAADATVHMHMTRQGHKSKPATGTPVPDPTSDSDSRSRVVVALGSCNHPDSTMIFTYGSESGRHPRP